MNDQEFGVAHDRWLANYHSYPAQVFCTTPACPRYGEPRTVSYTSEYGQGWTEPEECEACKGEFSFDAPPELEEEDDEDES